MTNFTKGEVRRSGEVLRAYLGEGEASVTRSDALDAVIVVREWRRLHQRPLTKATNGLRSMVATCGYEVEVSQRLKRLTTIVDKLLRQPDMALPRMQDIGGCRAVVPTVDAVYAVHRRMRRTGRVQRSKDYIAEPATSGYRGLHVIVKYDELLIEAQVRTQAQHEWAVTVERLGGRLDSDLKSGVGPEPVLDLMAKISQVMALEEQGLPADRATMAELDRLRGAATPWLRGDPS